jgi:hypothetical protein
MRVAASALVARSTAAAKNPGDWPLNSPLFLRPVIAATAPKIAGEVETGRMIEHTGNFRLRNGHGSGMIRLVWKSSLLGRGALRSGKTSPLVGSVRGGALPALVLPGLEMHGLGRANAEQDSQDHRIGDLQGQGRIEAGAALLDRGKMECRGVGDGLNMRFILYVGIGSGDCRMRPFE